MEVLRYNYNSKEMKKSTIDSNTNNNINENNTVSSKKKISEKVKGNSIRKSIDMKSKIITRNTESHLTKNINESKNK